MSVRPQLRGLLANKLKKDFMIGFAVSFAAAAAWYVGIKQNRINRYEDFNKNYDIEKDYARMRDCGVFTSVRPGGKVGEGW